MPRYSTKGESSKISEISFSLDPEDILDTVLKRAKVAAQLKTEGSTAQIESHLNKVRKLKTVFIPFKRTKYNELERSFYEPQTQ